MPATAEPVVRLFNDLLPHISQDRLAAFYKKPADHERIVLARYSYNIALCEALYPLFHILEVTLRNAICRAVSTRVSGTGTVDPTTHRIDSWLDRDAANTPILHHGQRVLVDDAKAEIVKSSRSLSEGRLIAELKFGFWTALFSHHYGDISPSQPRLWPSLFSVALPYLDQSRYRRSDVDDRLRRIRLLRNRVFHHEPVWRRNIRLDQKDILEVLGWMSREATALAEKQSRVIQVVKGSLEPHEQTVKAMIETFHPATAS